jgi:hypothetical protein
MVMTATEKIGRLEARNAALEQRIKVLEARLEPKPAPRVAPPPAWAGSGENTGSGYCGAPTIAASGTSWIKERRENGDWKDPFGQWRYASGELIPRTIEPQPIGPVRDWQHDEAVRTLDNMIERDAALDRQR